ncbi:WD40-repeat-containing domain protein [Mycena galopus ATCC 62051]|nr:WD40-repeat-containing domain protein [Mycena galopus ATCC 62051]
MSSPAPASPTHLIRSHSSDVTALFFSDDNERLYSGDASGRVVVTSTRSLRAIVSWLAHTDGIMACRNGARASSPIPATQAACLDPRRGPACICTRRGSAVLSDLPTPVLCYSLDVNALNYCRFSLLPSPSNPDEGLIALPNLVESSEADIWVLPSKQRIHASVGTERTQPMFSLGGREGMRTGLIMSMHLFRTTPPAEGPSARTGELRLLGAYEDGSVALRRFVDSTGQTSVEGRGWEIVWKYKLHVEAIMAMRVSRDNRLALTVSADHLVGRYDLATEAGVEGDAGVSPGTVHRTSHPGNGCVAIRDDGRVCAIGGWDGKIRLYSTKNLKSLGTLRYHKSGCQAVEFARSVEDPAPAGEKDDEDEEMTAEELEARGRWLAAGAKDHRVSLWALISFGKA